MTCLPVTVGLNNELARQHPGRQEDGRWEELRGEGDVGVGSSRDVLSESVSQVVPQALAPSHT